MDIGVYTKLLTGGAAMGLDARGQDFLVVVAKATWSIPHPGQRPRPLEATPVCRADEFHGEPGLSGMRYGQDLARFKSRCDVIFDAYAHSPDGTPMRSWTCGWQVGHLRKQALVHGPRTWQSLLGIINLSEAEPVVRVPLHFGYAFGGTRKTVSLGQALGLSRDPDNPIFEASAANPSGLGWFGSKSVGQCAGQSVHQVEDPRKRISSPTSKNPPHAFGPLPPYSLQRRQYAGSCDSAWQQNVFPFLPEDFDERHHQVAPEDQQMPYLKGQEQVVLENLLPGTPRLSFQLPTLPSLAVQAMRKDGTSEQVPMVADTLFFETEPRRFSIVRRAAVRIRRHPSEFSFVGIGPPNSNWDQVAGTCTSCGGRSSAAAQKQHASNEEETTGEPV
jgi:hypothetical protein